MLPKPDHLGEAYAAQFSDPAVVAAYPHRLPYLSDVFPFLAGPCVTPRSVLDIGRGTGDIARPLAPLVDRVDSVDISAPMITLGRSLPGGDDPRLRWLFGRAEDVPLGPPYGLVTAGESLHWMRWDVLLPRPRRLLAPGGPIAIAGRGTTPEPWREGLQALFPRYSTNRDFRPYNLLDELVQRRLYTCTPHAATPHSGRGTPTDGRHSRIGLSRDRLSAEAAEAFDRAVSDLVAPFATDGVLTLQSVSRVSWGLAHTE